MVRDTSEEAADRTEDWVHQREEADPLGSDSLNSSGVALRKRACVQALSPEVLADRVIGVDGVQPVGFALHYLRVFIEGLLLEVIDEGAGEDEDDDVGGDDEDEAASADQASNKRSARADEKNSTHEAEASLSEENRCDGIVGILDLDCTDVPVVAEAAASDDERNRVEKEETEAQRQENDDVADQDEVGVGSVS